MQKHLTLYLDRICEKELASSIFRHGFIVYEFPNKLQNVQMFRNEEGVIDQHFQASHGP